MTRVDLEPIKRSLADAPPEQRAELAHWLLYEQEAAGVDASSEEDLRIELDRRMEDMKTGRVKPLTHEQFWQRFRDRR